MFELCSRAAGSRETLKISDSDDPEYNGIDPRLRLIRGMQEPKK